MLGGIFMKAKVKKDQCIGCGACTMIAEDVFEIDDDGLAVCTKEKVPKEKEEDAVEAMESCPVSAIEIENE